MCHQDVACAPDPKEGKIRESKDVKQEVFLVRIDEFLLGEDSLQHTRREPTNMSHFSVERSVSVVGQQPDEGF